MNLNMFFQPRSVAVIGASRKKDSAGYGILKSLVMGGVFRSKTNRAFEGKIYAINPNARKILNKKCYNKVSDIKDPVDLAVIVVNAKIVPYVMKDCVTKGVKGVIIISAGFGELGEEGRKLQDNIIKIAKNGNIRKFSWWDRS